MSDSSSSPAPGSPIPSSYAPQEPAVLLWLENASFAGNSMGAIFYGVVLVLFFQCTIAILSPSNKQTSGHKKAMLAYVSWMFALGTIFTAMNLNLQQRSYIAFREFPGGPLGYGLSQYSTWRAIVPNAVYIITNWFADGLLMYRCYVIYNMQRWVVVLPMIMFGGSISMGIITLYKSSRPGSNLWAGITVNFGLPYFTISVALNVLLTLLISFRLLQHSRRFNQAMSSSSGSLYKNIITMLVESCALYAVVSILFIGTYAAENYASDLFLPILSQAQIIAPFLIILRVATQRSVTDTIEYGSDRPAKGSHVVSTLRIASNPSATLNETGQRTANTGIAMTSFANGSFDYDHKTDAAAYGAERV